MSRQVLATNLLFAISMLVGNAIHASEANQTARVHKDLEFAKVDGRSLRLDLMLPTGIESPPLVVWIHGGGWRGGSKSSVPIRGLVDHGYAVASISYRFTDVAIFPAQIHDCKAAIRWLRAHAHKYGYDEKRFVVAGSSAGGHLALLVGVSGDDPSLEGRVGSHFDQSSAVQAVVDYFGPADFVLRRKTQPERALTTKSGSFALLGGIRNGKMDPKLERLASPAMHVTPDDPPLLLFHGDQDETVLLDQSQRMLKAYHKAGAVAELVVFKDARHGGKVFYTKERIQQIVAFLKRNRIFGAPSE